MSDSTTYALGPRSADASLVTVLTKPTFAEEFYAAFFRQYPHYETLFAGTDPTPQHAVLTIALQRLVDWHCRPTILARQCLRLLGEKHRSLGIEAEDYDHFFRVLLDELARVHGPQWTPALADQWQAVFARSTDVMLEGKLEDLKALRVTRLALTAEIIHGLNGSVEKASQLFTITEQINQGVVIDDHRGPKPATDRGT